MPPVPISSTTVACAQFIQPRAKSRLFNGTCGYRIHAIAAVHVGVDHCQMPLQHTSPTPTLATELDEVASNAQALIEVLRRGLNVPLPVEFPRDQLIDICVTLVQLPEGTAEGCRAPLEYARKRLPSIRREHIATDHVQGGKDAPLLVRGALLDQKLATLISSVSTALDAYGRLAADETGTDFKPEAGIKASKTTVDDVVTSARDLDNGLGVAQKTIKEVAQPGSTQADTLQRQLQDARGLTQLTSAEVRMPRVVPGWLRSTVDALKGYPDLIRSTMTGLHVGADVAEVWIDRWHEFKHESFKFLFEQFRKTTKAGERTADILDRQQKGNAPPPKPVEPEIDNDVGAARAVRRRDQVQADVRRCVKALEEVEDFIRLHSRINDNLAALGPSPPSIAHAQKLRSEHQAKLIEDLSELGRIDRYLTMNRQFAVAAGDGISPPISAAAEPTLGVVGQGYAQRIFQLMVLMVLREVGRPMQSGEVVDAFAARGHPIGGTNPTRTAWNRLWEAKTNGLLEQVADHGYWIKGESLRAGALEAALASKEERRKRSRNRVRNVRRPGGRHGRQPMLSPADIESGRRWILEGRPVAQVCADLGGISLGTFRNYFGSARALREKYPHLAKPLRQKPRLQKSTGRRPKLSPDQIATVKDMHASGYPVRRIAEKMQAGERLIYTAIGGIRKPAGKGAKR